jgi:hypothetical protein
VKDNRATSFLIDFHCLWLVDASDVNQDFRLINYQTREILKIKREEECRLTISRFPIRTYIKEWMDEMEKHSRYAAGYSRQIIFEI